MSIIDIKNLTKIYDDTAIKTTAVNNINLTFKEGEFTAIVGPSGSGKTTFLNLLGGLDKPTQGNIFIEGTDITKLNSCKLTNYRLNNIGFVFQSFNLIPVLSARENVEFIMHLQGRSKKERIRRAIELLNEVGLSHKVNSRPYQLSGGQQQRVAVARALASKPKFILADEPTANLDSVATDRLLNLMHELNEIENMTFIFATHDSRVVSKAERIIYFEDGKITDDIKQ